MNRDASSALGSVAAGEKRVAPCARYEKTESGAEEEVGAWLWDWGQHGAKAQLFGVAKIEVVIIRRKPPVRVATDENPAKFVHCDVGRVGGISTPGVQLL